MTAKVTFIPENITSEAPEGTPLIELARKSGVILLSPCGGRKECGKCKIKVTSTKGIPEPTDIEKECLHDQELEEGIRMGCQFRLPSEGHLTVEECYRFHFLHKDALAGKIKERAGRSVSLLTIKAHGGGNAGSLDERVALAALEAGFQEIEIPPTALQEGSKFDSKLSELSAIVIGDRIVDIYPFTQKRRQLGVALDLGTTTLVGYLVDFTSLSCAGERCIINPNGSYGADVMSRISRISREPAKLEQMQSELIGAINQMVDGFVTSGISRQDIVSVVAVGNTFMMHIFWGISPQSLALSPYMPVFKGKLLGKGRDLGLKINQEAMVITLPCIGGFVGADTTGAIIATSISDSEECFLLVDIGTNGEIVLGKNGDLVATSVAAGPAFEGVHMNCGMLAASGAVSSIKVDEDGVLTIGVIDEKPPVGICGSGVVSGVDALLRAEVIDSRGIFKDPGSLPPRLRERIIQTEECGKAFVIAYTPEKKPIYISQKDIRELQLAKAAIYAGIELLLRELRLTYMDIEKVYLSGVFGNYLDIDSALNLRILPQVKKEKIIPVGNAAAGGAILSLLDIDNLDKVERLARSIRYIPMSGRRDFFQTYMQAMRFE